MSIFVGDVVRAMDAWAPQDLAYEWDKVGLHIGSLDTPVTRVMICLTVTEAAFRAARRARAEMIVAHHPLIWEPLKALHTDAPHTRLCLDIAKAGMACFAAHTNLDVVPDGVNGVLAGALGVETTDFLFKAQHARMVKLVCFVPERHLAAVRDAVCAAGAGGIGNYTHCTFSSSGTGTFLPGAEADPYSGKKGVVNEEPERRFEVLVPKEVLFPVIGSMLKAHPYEEVAYDVIPVENQNPEAGLGRMGYLEKPRNLETFAKRVCHALHLDHARVIGAPKKKIKYVGLLGGSGGGEMAKLPGGIDVFVTGDVKYHDALEAAERGIAVIDAGHRGTDFRYA